MFGHFSLMLWGGTEQYLHNSLANTIIYLIGDTALQINVYMKTSLSMALAIKSKKIQTDVRNLVRRADLLMFGTCIFIIITHIIVYFGIRYGSSIYMKYGSFTGRSTFPRARTRCSLPSFARLRARIDNFSDDRGCAVRGIKYRVLHYDYQRH
jgi:hypothetical protein